MINFCDSKSVNLRGGGEYNTTRCDSQEKYLVPDLMRHNKFSWCFVEIRSHSYVALPLDFSFPGFLRDQKTNVQRFRKKREILAVSDFTLFYWLRVSFEYFTVILLAHRAPQRLRFRCLCNIAFLQNTPGV